MTPGRLRKLLKKKILNVKLDICRRYCMVILPPPAFRGKHIIFVLSIRQKVCMTTLRKYLTKISQNLHVCEIHISLWNFERTIIFSLRLFHQKVCTCTFTYILNVNSSKLCMLADYNIKISISLQQFDSFIPSFNMEIL